MRCSFTHITLVTLIVSSASFASPSPTKAARLLKSVAADARQIQSSASGLEKLAANSSATWKQYDRQWNEIQPVVETMHMKIARLEAMESSLTPSEKQALAQAKSDYQKIAWRSRDLGKLVDMVPPDLSSPKFKADGRDLAKEAGDVVRAAKI